MTDIQKLRFILNLLVKTEIKLSGAKEAFLFTESYEYLLEQVKKLEKQNGN